MKPTLPHDPFDDLIAAALHGELTPDEQAQFNHRLQTDPAARAAYHEAQLMHDLLEKTHRSAQPDSSFEQRMVSGVRRKIQHPPSRETAWGSLVVLWKGLKRILKMKSVQTGLVVCVVIAFLAAAMVPATMGNLEKAKQI